MRFMYMHTLDGKPASLGWSGKPFLYFVGGRSPAKLVPTLKQLRREQRECRRTAASEDIGYFSNPKLADAKRYGHVRVLFAEALV